MILGKNFHLLYYNQGLNMQSIFNFLDNSIKKIESNNQDVQVKVTEKFGY